jgi:hypothetical protein
MTEQLIYTFVFFAASFICFMAVRELDEWFDGRYQVKIISFLLGITTGLIGICYLIKLFTD